MREECGEMVKKSREKATGKKKREVTKGRKKGREGEIKERTREKRKMIGKARQEEKGNMIRCNRNRMLIEKGNPKTLTSKWKPKLAL